MAAAGKRRYGRCLIFVELDPYLRRLLGIIRLFNELWSLICGICSLYEHKKSTTTFVLIPKAHPRKSIGGRFRRSVLSNSCLLFGSAAGSNDLALLQLPISSALKPNSASTSSV